MLFHTYLSGFFSTALPDKCEAIILLGARPRNRITLAYPHYLPHQCCWIIGTFIFHIVRLLGVTLDNFLTFREHANQIHGPNLESSFFSSFADSAFFG